jgi:hypothetical protein
VFNARVDPRTAVSPGSALRLAIDPAHFHFFDRETGENIGLRREAPARVSEAARAE